MPMNTKSNSLLTLRCRDDLESKVRDCMQIFSQTFTKYKPNEVFLSFNGGKDCTVLLHLLLKVFDNGEDLKNQLRFIYVQPAEPFDEVEEFVEQCQEEYSIKIETIRGNIKQVLTQMCDASPNIKACLMGCRSTDPYCKQLNVFTKTDPNWPQIMRVNPLLQWTCKDIWNYFTEYSVPYCIMYDYGYTSLGDKTNTVPNPYLKYVDPNTGDTCFKEARTLLNADNLERAGRL